MIHKNIHITGRVQGVGFRYATRNAARQFSVTGFVRNLPDGNVYIEAESTPEQMELFISWCWEGPPRADVKYLDLTDGEVRGFEEFVIK
ncbi:MAG TPA: acylphosphatase [Bacteroidales bacterium]|nr:acylphosphatase [Bacteroidales bacterium]